MDLNEKLKRQFRRIYNADLLSIAMESIALGDIVEWDGFLKKKMDFEAYSLIENLKLDSIKKNELKKQLVSIALEKAYMQKIIIDSRFNIKGGVDIPNFATSIGLNLGFDRFLNFNMDDVKCKIISRELKVEIRDVILKAKDDDKKHFRKNLKHLHFIDKLFYAGNVSFEMKDITTTEVEAALTATKILNPKVGINTSGNIKVTFAGSTEIPFAADIEQLTDFID